MKESFEHFLFNRLEVNPKGKFLLAVSGGMDSMCLWDLFRRSGLNFIVAHCNFKLRDEASEGDEAFVREFAGKRDKVYVRSFDTAEYARDRSLSIQMAARELRYAWFEELKKKEDCDYIVTAHHLDDQVETFFIQLLRRSSLSAMSGMPVKTEKVIRPLMFAGRESIDTYVHDMGIPFREDESNQSDIYLRNRIRRNLIPLLQKVLPDLKISVLELMGNLKDVSDSFDNYFEKVEKEVVREEKGQSLIDIRKLKDSEFPLFFLEKYLKKLGFSSDVARNLYDIMDGEAGKMFYSSSFRLIKDRNDIIILPLKLTEEDKIRIDKASITTVENLFFKAEVLPFDRRIMNRAENKIALLDFESLAEELVLRKWKKGDYFHPLGLGGRKKLSDFFVDRKFSLADKESQWILCSGEDICWIVGEAIDDRFKIRDNTKDVLLLEQI